MKQKNKKATSLKWKLVPLLFICWLTPLIIVFSALAYDMTENYQNRINKEFTTSIIHGLEIASIHLELTLEGSREASRQSAIKEGYENYLKNNSGVRLFEKTNNFLIKYFRYEKKSKLAVISYNDTEMTPFYTFNSREGGSYDNYKYYIKNIHQKVKNLSRNLDTKVGFVTHENRIYMVRNIVNANFEPYAIIVIELNADYIFELFNNSSWIEGYRFSLNGEEYKDENFPLENKFIDQFNSSHSFSRNVKRDDLLLYGKKTDGDIKINYIIKIKNPVINQLLSNYSLLLFVFLFLLILLSIVIIYFSYTNIFTPISYLISATRAIEKGDYGYQIENDFKNSEFSSLGDSVNHMSLKLKTQFEQIYNEELALKDAKIMALQSQINPHFLNNTLEIINWEARLQGKDKISRMIESLSTMLHAATDRNANQVIPLKKELEYVDSYLYIVKERFSERIIIEKNIRDDTLKIDVPRLILQPIIENSIEHGMNFAYACKINIKSYLKDDFLYLEIINNSPLKKSNRKAIEALLSEDRDNAEYRTKMGIFNVNSRLKMIYGENSGLSISDDGKNTIAVVKILISKEKKN